MVLSSLKRWLLVEGANEGASLHQSLWGIIECLSSVLGGGISEGVPYIYDFCNRNSAEITAAINQKSPRKEWALESLEMVAEQDRKILLQSVE